MLFRSEDEAVQINREDPRTGFKYFDIGASKFDLVVRAGGNYITQREQFVEVMAQIFQSNPDLMQIMGDKFFANMDFPGADEISRRFAAMLPPSVKAADKAGANGEDEPQAGTYTQEQVQQMIMQAVEKAKAEGELAIKGGELKVKEFEAQTDRMETVADIKNQGEELKQKMLAVLAEFFTGLHTSKQSAQPAAPRVQ